jgi:hypothetical protein
MIPKVDRYSRFLLLTVLFPSYLVTINFASTHVHLLIRAFIA